ncbi:TPA: hypothetical protein ACH3X2_003589 [Trebouxia sp. C0005]
MPASAAEQTQTNDSAVLGQQQRPPVKQRIISTQGILALLAGTVFPPVWFFCSKSTGRTVKAQGSQSADAANDSNAGKTLAASQNLQELYAKGA